MRSHDTSTNSLQIRSIKRVLIEKTNTPSVLKRMSDPHKKPQNANKFTSNPINQTVPNRKSKCSFRPKKKMSVCKPRTRKEHIFIRKKSNFFSKTEKTRWYLVSCERKFETFFWSKMYSFLSSHFADGTIFSGRTEYNIWEQKRWPGLRRRQQKGELPKGTSLHHHDRPIQCKLSGFC